MDKKEAKKEMNKSLGFPLFLLSIFLIGFLGNLIDWGKIFYILFCVGIVYLISIVLSHKKAKRIKN